MADEWIRQNEFGDLIGVTSRTVFNLRKSGLEQYCRTRGNAVEIKVPDGVIWYVAYRERIATEHVSPSSIEEAQRRYETARAEKAEIELARMRGQLVALVHVELWVGELFARARSRLDGLPTLIAQRVNAEGIPERRAQAQLLVDDVLAELQAGSMPPEGTMSGEAP